jgi:hypothetical protein
MKQLPYVEGSAFLVPLRGGGYARGVVARASPKGKALLGYFFGPRLETADIASWADVGPKKAVLRVIFGDLGLINGEWPTCGKLPGWDRPEWPMPDFVRSDPLGVRKPVLVRHSDTDPLRVELEFTIDDDSGLTTDGVYGYVAVEIELTKLLG